jgi:DNA-binding LytR/AlgR family response regulator
VALIEQSKPDIVLLDIQMPGIDGLEVARRKSRGPFVIFVTAHADYALEAFKALTVDYLLKPVQEEALRGALEKFEQLIGRAQPTQQFAPLAIALGGVVRNFDPAKIVLLEADNKYTTIYSEKGPAQVTEWSLSDLQQRLPPELFVRVHRKHLVNRRFIAALQPAGGRRLCLEIKGLEHHTVLVSRHYRHLLGDAPLFQT